MGMVTRHFRGPSECHAKNKLLARVIHELRRESAKIAQDQGFGEDERVKPWISTAKSRSKTRP